MPAVTAVPPEAVVAVLVPASAARVAADRLAAESRREERTGDPSLCPSFTVVASALRGPIGAREQLPERPTPAEVREVLEARATEQNVAAYLPVSLAVALLEARGWTRCVQTSRSRFGTPLTSGDYTSWTRPGHTSRADGGAFGVDYLWETEDALTHALAAEALGVSR